MSNLIIDRARGVIASQAIKVPCDTVALTAIQLMGLQQINGFQTLDGSRVLVTAQANPVDNGIYEASALGWRRSPDFDGSSDVTSGTLIRALVGEGQWWELTTTNPVIGVSNLSFRDITAGGGTPTGGAQFDILAINGSKIENGQGTLTLTANRIDGDGYQALTSGNVQLFANGVLVTEANGFGPGSNGYIGVFDAGDINGSLVVSLRDGPAGQVFDTKTLVDIADGSPAPIMVFSRSGKRAFYKAPNGGPWDGTGVVLTAEMYQSGTLQASAEVTVALDEVAGTLSSTETQSDPDITITYQGLGTATITVTARHTNGASESEEVFAIEGGSQGQSAVSPILAQLTQHTAAVSAASDGTGYSLAGIGGRFELYQGEVDVSGSAAFSVLNPATVNGLTLAIDSAGLYTLSGGSWNSDSAEFTIRAILNSVNYDRIFKITKSRAGADGGIGSQPEIIKAAVFSNGKQWVRANNAGDWTPLTAFTLATWVWCQGPDELARIVLRFTLNTSTGNITVTEEGSATGGATFTVQNNGTRSASATVVRNGIEATETVSALVGADDGDDGLPGISGLVEGVGVGAVGDIVFAKNTPATHQVRITGNSVFAKNGTKVDISSGVDDVILPAVEMLPYYIVLGVSAANSRFGTGFSSHNFFAATYDTASGQWTARGSGNQQVDFAPPASDTIVAIGRKTAATIETVSSYVNPMLFDAANIGFYVQNGAIGNALINDLAANKISTGQIIANLANLGSLTVEGTGRIVMDNGTFIKVQGIGFGSSNQFLEWFGPKLAESQMTEANAISYLKTDGSAYFGGTLSAGILTNAGQTSDTGAAAEIVVGPFGSNGGPKSIVLSYSRAAGELYYGPNPPGTNGQQISTVVKLERALGTGGYATIGDYTFTGTYTEDGPIPTPQGDEYDRREVISGSITVADNTNSSQNYTYRARMTALNIVGTGLPTQRLGVVITEQ